MKRYNFINKAKAANVFGILVTNPNTSNFLEILSRVKTILKSANKKFFKFIISKKNNLNNN